jgi:hypothetical protein
MGSRLSRLSVNLVGEMLLLMLLELMVERSNLILGSSGVGCRELFYRVAHPKGYADGEGRRGRRGMDGSTEDSENKRKRDCECG